MPDLRPDGYRGDDQVVRLTQSSTESTTSPSRRPAATTNLRAWAPMRTRRPGRVTDTSTHPLRAPVALLGLCTVKGARRISPPAEKVDPQGD